MLVFLERTPEFESLRNKFQIKFEGFFDTKVPTPKTTEENSTNGSTFTSTNSPNTPRSKLLQKLKNIFWLRLAQKYEIKGLCLLYTSPSPRDGLLSRMPSSA